MGGLPGFDPVTNVAPFTYRDGATYLQILTKLQEKLNEVIDGTNLLDQSNAGEHSRIARELTEQFNKSLADIRAELSLLIEDIAPDGLANDPTTGQRLTGASRVISNVYDNARVFAYFAAQYDALNLTASQYDGMNYAARHFDLGVTYPVLNDVLN